MEPSATICGTADHRSGKARSASHLHQQTFYRGSTGVPKTATININRAIHWTARQQEQQRATDRSTMRHGPLPVKIAIAPQPTANRSAIDRRICDGHRLLLPRQPSEPKPACKKPSAKRTQQVVPTVDGLCMHSNYQQWVSRSPYRNYYNDRRVLSETTTSATLQSQEWQRCQMGDDPPKRNNKSVQANSHR
jgi:hypothetical protein